MLEYFLSIVAELTSSFPKTCLTFRATIRLRTPQQALSKKFSGTLKIVKASGCRLQVCNSLKSHYRAHPGNCKKIFINIFRKFGQESEPTTCQPAPPMEISQNFQSYFLQDTNAHGTVFSKTSILEFFLSIVAELKGSFSKTCLEFRATIRKRASQYPLM